MSDQGNNGKRWQRNNQEGERESNRIRRKYFETSDHNIFDTMNPSVLATKVISLATHRQPPNLKWMSIVSSTPSSFPQEYVGLSQATVEKGKIPKNLFFPHRSLRQLLNPLSNNNNIKKYLS
ncbi:hypothetical protein JTE90_000071 [Oedothorax gibbosus]|uniref:Uncharacterized protein n=1 Tax=Oedothorax gibbosus TaxID=931172 RepID=A0AAV6UCG2_9ARAC|nr:hypothetical protein JTE90_000071 [Oedothorax gibbosus]